MAQTIQIKRGLESSRSGFTPIVGELIWTTDSEKLYMGDGSTAGGVDFITDAQGAYVPLTQKGAVSGVATLGTDQKIPLTQLKVIDDTTLSSTTTYSSTKIDTLLTTGVAYMGHWDASTNTPALVDGTGSNGHFYIVDTAGTQDLGSGSISYEIGDYVIYTDDDGAGPTPGVWEKTINSNKVDEVNQKTGIVVLDGSDIELTGYVIPASTGTIVATDTINSAIGKLEKGLEDAVAGGGDVNVQSDWDQTNTGSDDYIKNKPVSVTEFDVTNLGSAQIITDLERTKLNGIADGAEVNVNADWNATTGDALILNKPTLVTEFADLSDVPAYSVSEASKVVSVNSAGDAIEYTTVENLGVGNGTWIGLSDTPGALGGTTILKGTRVNATGTAIEFVDRKITTQDDVDVLELTAGDYLSWNGSAFTNAPLPSSVSAFVGLTDTPTDYTGASGYNLQVNTAGDAVEFVDTSVIDGGTF